MDDSRWNRGLRYGETDSVSAFGYYWKGRLDHSRRIQTLPSLQWEATRGYIDPYMPAPRPFEQYQRWNIGSLAAFPEGQNPISFQENKKK